MCTNPRPARTLIRYASRPAGNCLNAHKTEIGSEQNNALSPRQRRTSRFGLQSLIRPMFHARALFRLARRRPILALGLAAGAASAVWTVGNAASTETGYLLHGAAMFAGVVPLAPAPAPPAPPAEVATQQQHHHLLGFPLNPLRGLASWYGSVWNGRTTASGETYDETKMTAAHKTLPLGTLVRVTNLSSKQSVVVRINDRGTLAPNRVIDLSSAAAREIGLIDQGLARVKLEILGKG
jgi:rare lipoprotein A